MSNENASKPNTETNQKAEVIDSNSLYDRIVTSMTLVVACSVLVA